VRLILISLMRGALVVGQPLRPQLGKQGRGGGIRNWWENPVINGLNLSDAQRRQIMSVTREFRNRMVDARAAVEKAEGEMNDLFNDGNAEDRRANDAIDRLAKARADLTRVVSQMSLKLRGVLTAEQWQELQRRERRPGGPPDGDPRGPGGFRGGPDSLRRPPPNGPGGPPPNGPPNPAQPKPGVL
jgi:Spy/CpxP family protein refolding chaperone